MKTILPIIFILISSSLSAMQDEINVEKLLKTIEGLNVQEIITGLNECHMTDLSNQDELTIKNIILSKFKAKMPINYINNHPEDPDCVRMNRYIEFVISEVKCFEYFKYHDRKFSLVEKVQFIENGPQKHAGLINYIHTGKKDNEAPIDTREQLDTYLKDLRKRLENPGNPLLKK